MVLEADTMAGTRSARAVALFKAWDSSIEEDKFTHANVEKESKLYMHSTVAKFH